MSSKAHIATTGEGLQETARRRRIEQACGVLRRTDCSLADIAPRGGFLRPEPYEPWI
ncbi:hypothetical protein [Sphingomonas sp.]|uniref:hypothetical protein n=1 Tax=Sphingomonas sp. TaxID=28214 RepID=UPI00286CCE76|nr:hypothetical protein [Sphingomonas sp.]